jgi:hypothetical protein
MVRGRPGSVLFEGKPLAPRGYDHFRFAIDENQEGVRR